MYKVFQRNNNGPLTYTYTYTFKEVLDSDLKLNDHITCAIPYDIKEQLFTFNELKKLFFIKIYNKPIGIFQIIINVSKIDEALKNISPKTLIGQESAADINLIIKYIRRNNAIPKILEE